MEALGSMMRWMEGDKSHDFSHVGWAVCGLHAWNPVSMQREALFLDLLPMLASPINQI